VTSLRRLRWRATAGSPSTSSGTGWAGWCHLSEADVGLARRRAGDVTRLQLVTVQVAAPACRHEFGRGTPGNLASPGLIQLAQQPSAAISGWALFPPVKSRALSHVRSELPQRDIRALQHRQVPVVTRHPNLLVADAGPDADVIDVGLGQPIEVHGVGKVLPEESQRPPTERPSERPGRCRAARVLGTVVASPRDAGPGAAARPTTERSPERRRGQSPRDRGAPSAGSPGACDAYSAKRVFAMVMCVRPASP
jgi:hypothetical protein